MEAVPRTKFSDTEGTTGSVCIAWREEYCYKYAQLFTSGSTLDSKECATWPQLLAYLEYLGIDLSLVVEHS